MQKTYTVWDASQLQPFQEWTVQGVGLVVRNLGIQEKSARFWSGVIAPLYPEALELSARMDFYTTCFREEYFDILDSLEEGDMIWFQAVMTPATENSAYDGRVRGRIRMRLNHCAKLIVGPSERESSDSFSVDEGGFDL